MSIGQMAGPAPVVAPRGERVLAVENEKTRVSRGWVLPVFGAVLGALVFLVVRGSLTDDSYITLAYAKNLAEHGEWGIIPGSPANSATSPLNVLLLGALTLVTRIAGGSHPVVALGILTVVCGGALGWAWQRIGQVLSLPTAAGVLGITLVLLNPFVLSAIGLEVLLIPAVLLVLTALALEGRAVWFGVAAWAGRPDPARPRRVRRGDRPGYPRDPAAAAARGGFRGPDDGAVVPGQLDRVRLVRARHPGDQAVAGGAVRAVELQHRADDVLPRLAGHRARVVPPGAGRRGRAHAAGPRRASPSAGPTSRRWARSPRWPRAGSFTTSPIPTSEWARSTGTTWRR